MSGVKNVQIQDARDTGIFSSGNSVLKTLADYFKDFQESMQRNFSNRLVYLYDKPAHVSC